MRGRGSQQASPFAKSILNHRRGQPRHGTQAHELAPDRGLSRFQFADPGHERGNVAVAVLDQTGQMRQPPRDIRGLATERVSLLRDIIAFGERNHLFDRVRRQCMRFHGLQHRFVHLGDRDPQLVTT
ncbi:MAG TPA: hypothetical protein VNJ02_19640 [Vicinamibacterales bacterium]|nr:hypothetical protein [Vicinamibacterales bacterium]